MELQITTKIDKYDLDFKNNHEDILKECCLVLDNLNELRQEMKTVITFLKSKKSEDIEVGYNLLVYYMNKLLTQSIIGRLDKGRLDKYRLDKDLGDNYGKTQTE